jgi:hypothetical protein
MKKRVRVRRVRKRMPTRAELMEMYVKAERTEPRTPEFIAWLLDIRGQAPASQQIEGGA